jgi:hypothetical protein
MTNPKLPKSFYLGRIILSIIVATLLFIGIFSFGYFIAFENYQGIIKDNDFILNYLIELQTQKELIGNSCIDLETLEFSDKLYEMNDFLGRIENQFGKNNPDVIEQKKKFTILQIQHYLIVKENNNNCNLKKPILLFFYSNQVDKIDEAEKKGFILSNYRKNHPDFIIYSLDFDLDSSLLKTLKRINNVDKPNLVIYNGEKIIFDNIDELKESINKIDLKTTSKDISSGNESNVIALN